MEDKKFYLFKTHRYKQSSNDKSKLNGDVFSVFEPYISLILICFSFVLFLNSPVSKAGKLMGAEQVIEQVGTHSYKLTLILYKNCESFSNLWQDKTINVNSACGNTSFNVSRQTIEKVENVCVSNCIRCQTGCQFSYGAEKHVYEGTFNLAGLNNCCEFEIIRDNCCTSNNLDNITNSFDFLRLESHINICQGNNFKTPEFLVEPVMLLCNNQPFLTTHRAKDSFGDSLKYKLVTPNDNSGIPMSWVSGFNENEPFDYHGKFSGNPDLPFPWGFHFNKITGDMKFKPVNEMIGLYTVEVTQYKDGNISSRVRRDVHKRIIDCPPNQTLELEEGLKEQYLVCANDTLVESLNFTDPDQSDSIYFKWLDTTGIPGAVFTSDSGIGTVYGHLYWQPDTSHISPHPYYATYFAKDNACPIIGTHARTINVYVNPEPEVTFNADIQSCGKVEFNADILNIDNGEFEWKINGNKVSSEDNFVKNLEPGTYPYSLKLTGVGCERVFYDTIVVPSFLTITAGVDTNICDGENYMLKPKVHNPEGNEDSVKFWVNNTSFFNSTVIEPTSDTTLIVVAEDVAGCLAVDSVHIDFYSLPEPDISDKFFCAGEGLDTASTIHFIDYNIEWRRANGQLLDAGANFPIPEPGNYELHIIDKELSRCSIIEAFEVIQDENVSFNTTDTLICKGFNMQINAGVNGISYQWRLLPDNQILSNNNQLNYTVEKSGEILIEVIRTIGNMFCAYSDTFLVDAGELPDSNIVHPGNKCINEGYVSLPEKANAINRIEWSGPGVTEGKIWNLKSAGTGLHQLEYTVTHDISGCELKGIKEVEIYNKPELSFKIDPITGEVPLTALLEADNINSLSDKKWTIQSDTGYQRTTYHNLYKFEHIFNKPGTYTITFSATDSTTGCRDTVRKDSIVNVYIHDNDTSNLLLRVNSSFLNVYPNPAGDVLYIHSLKTLSSITLTTITGREVRSISPKTNEVKIERKELTPGSYILQVKHIDGSVERKQVIFR